MSIIKRERWTEADIDALPPGEHDYFERKSGQLFADTGNLLGKLAKTVSAMSNSGGGHIILGVADSGEPDGVPCSVGRTPMREWLEQKLPHLVDYPISDFRVHVVERSMPSSVPRHREVIVIDIGDSALAPHQCVHGGGDARKFTYYYRQAGRSEPAPHFYLELLRQRLVNPVLEATIAGCAPIDAKRIEGGVFLVVRMEFLIRNLGRMAAQKWELQLREINDHPDDRIDDYYFGRVTFPRGMGGNLLVRMDDTLLGDSEMAEHIDLGLLLRPVKMNLRHIREEIEAMLVPIALGYRVATETSPGEIRHIKLRDWLCIEEIVAFVREVLTDIESL